MSRVTANNFFKDDLSHNSQMEKAGAKQICLKPMFKGKDVSRNCSVYF